jgi:hypothetical protein
VPSATATEVRHFISTFPAELFVVTADPDAVLCIVVLVVEAAEVDVGVTEATVPPLVAVADVVDLVNSVAFVDAVADAEDA